MSKTTKRGSAWCAAPCCRLCAKDDPELNFFRYPKDPARLAEWIRNSKRHDLFLKPANYAHNNCRLCSRHFDESAFTKFRKVGGRRRLKHDAVPTIFLFSRKKQAPNTASLPHKTDGEVQSVEVLEEKSVSKSSSTISVEFEEIYLEEEEVSADEKICTEKRLEEIGFEEEKVGFEQKEIGFEEEEVGYEEEEVGYEEEEVGYEEEEISFEEEVVGLEEEEVSYEEVGLEEEEEKVLRELYTREELEQVSALDDEETRNSKLLCDFCGKLGHSVSSCPESVVVLDMREWRIPITSSGEDAVDITDIEYNMEHSRRGNAIIFNHYLYQNRYKEARFGSNIDVRRLRTTFSELGFEVSIHENLSMQQIIHKLSVLSKDDHSEADCLVIIVLTHGDLEDAANYVLSAYDRPYPFKNLWAPFTTDVCQTLSGKPKIFIIQACRNAEDPKKINLTESKQNPSQVYYGGGYTIPHYADFLFVFNTFEGFSSCKDQSSCFIQHLCNELDKSAAEEHLLDILTRVKCLMSIQFDEEKESMQKRPSEEHNFQVPSTNSMLLRKVYFRPKFEYC